MWCSYDLLFEIYIKKMSRSTRRRVPKDKEMEERVQQSKIRKQLHEDAAAFIHDDNENPADYEPLDSSRVSLVPDGTKFKVHNLFALPPGEESDYTITDLAELDSTWKIHEGDDRPGQTVPTPVTVEGFKGAIVFDHQRYVNNDDKKVNELLAKFGSMDPKSNETKKWIDRQVKARLKNDTKLNATDEVRLRMRYEGQIQIANIMRQTRENEPDYFPSSTNPLSTLPTTTDDTTSSTKSSVWSEGPPLPRDRDQRRLLPPPVKLKPLVLPNESKKQPIHESSISPFIPSIPIPIPVPGVVLPKKVSNSRTQKISKKRKHTKDHDQDDDDTSSLIHQSKSKKKMMIAHVPNLPKKTQLRRSSSIPVLPLMLQPTTSVSLSQPSLSHTKASPYLSALPSFDELKTKFNVREPKSKSKTKHKR